MSKGLGCDRLEKPCRWHEQLDRKPFGFDLDALGTQGRGCVKRSAVEREERVLRVSMAIDIGFRRFASIT
jgi:hypothetical protein